MSIDAATLDSTSATRPAVRAEARTEARWTRDGDSGETTTVRDDLSFWDFLDVINPLQHIPVVGTLYRAITGDTIQPAARVVGGILYGGPIGGMAAVANAVVEQTQGKDIGDQIMASLGLGADDHPAAPVATAAVTTGGPAAGSPAQPFQGPTQVATGQVATGQPGQPAANQPAQSAQSALQAALRAADGGQGALPAASSGAPGSQPIRLGAAAQAQAQAQAAQTALAAQLAGQEGQPFSRPTKMPARDTNLANTLQAKHAAPKAAPFAGSTASAAATAKAAGAPAPTSAPAAAADGLTPVAPDRLSETMMRNLAKYEQSRRATQPAPAAGMRVSG